MGVGELFFVAIATPVLVVTILWIRKKRALLGIRCMRITFLTLGIFMIARSVYVALKYVGVHSVLDIQVKSGIGLLLGGLICAVLECKYANTSPQSCEHEGKQHSG